MADGVSPDAGHRHPANAGRHDGLSWQDRLPDRLTAAIGTMRFILWSTIVIALWVGINGLGLLVWQWDPYPFVFLNLGFSAFAFYSAPLILMSQNRQSEHDRVRAEHDYELDKEALAWTKAIAAHLGVTDPAIEADAASPRTSTLKET